MSIKTAAIIGGIVILALVVLVLLKILEFLLPFILRAIAIFALGFVLGLFVKRG